MFVDVDATPRLVLKEKVEQELISLQDDGMISPVHFSDWATLIVLVVKNDGIVKLQQIQDPTHCHT